MQLTTAIPFKDINSDTNNGDGMGNKYLPTTTSMDDYFPTGIINQLQHKIKTPPRY